MALDINSTAPRYLTKSRFKLGLACETKLFYTKKKGVYADQSLDDSFLLALAEGGFQVGELAKFYFCDDPVGQAITIETLDYEEALAETQARIAAGQSVLAEAAFRYENLFIRTDIVEIYPEAKQINLIEVKAKSYSSDDSFFTYDRKTEEVKGISTTWRDYLYDVAFQKYVLKKLYPDHTIKAYLVLADKGTTANIGGLNQFFKINKANGRVKTVMPAGLNRDMLGDAVLIQVGVDDEVNWIWKNPVPTDLSDTISFSEYIGLLSEKYKHDEKIPTPLGSKCSACEFKTTEKQDAAGELKSGFRECWRAQAGLSDEELARPLVTELWGGLSGRRSLKQALIDDKVYLLENVRQDAIASKSKGKEYQGLSPLERRMQQVKAAQTTYPSVYLDCEGLKREMAAWVYPLHFIDFETSRVALPFHTGRRPYEQIAFQFSHHIVREDGSIAHAGQYISCESAVFPNYDFLRALQQELTQDSGTIFRYHNHENNVLLDIYKQLQQDPGVADRDELMAFIRTITHGKCAGEEWEGDRNMVDLYKLVLSYYYPPAAGGSNSLKYILPATIQASTFLQNKYSKPVYGSDTMPSQNFKEKVWLTPENPCNPYKALPAIFEEYDADTLDQLVEGFDEIADGGAAMTAYAKLQFSDVPADQRELIRGALLKYCELDTLAMVMIWEYWNAEDTA